MKEIVIKISEESYKAICKGYVLPLDADNMVRAIKNGTPLPKGHGDLIDADDLVRFISHHAYPIRYDCNSIEQGMSITGINQCINESQKIIEADKEGEEK